MKNKKFIAAAAAALMLLCCTAASFALDYSAEFIEKEGDVTRKGKIFMTKDKSRFEIEGVEGIEVTRADKGVMWLIFPKRKVYIEEEFEGALPDHTSTPEIPKSTGDLSREDLGYEMVNTFRMKKFLVTVKYNKGETEDRYYEWYRSDFPIPVKMESLDGAVSYEYKKIKFEQQDPRLFNAPNSYKKVSADELEKLEEKWKEKDKSKKKKSRSKKAAVRAGEGKEKSETAEATVETEDAVSSDKKVEEDQ